MIKNNGCCDLEYAIKLKELGVKQDSVWYWIESPKGGTLPLPDFYLKQASISYYQLEIMEGRECYSAFTVAELGEELPGYITYNKVDYLLDITKAGVWYIHYIEYNNHESILIGFDADTLANALAKMLIWLIEKGHIKVEELLRK